MQAKRPVECQGEIANTDSQTVRSPHTAHVSVYCAENADGQWCSDHELSPVFRSRDLLVRPPPRDARHHAARARARVRRRARATPRWRAWTYTYSARITIYYHFVESKSYRSPK